MKNEGEKRHSMAIQQEFTEMRVRIDTVKARRKRTKFTISPSSNTEN